MLAEKLSGSAGGSSTPVYVEDVFATSLYTGTGRARSIHNGIALGNTFSVDLTGLPVTAVSGNFASPYILDYLTDGIIPPSNANFSYADSGTYFDVYVDLGTTAAVTAYKLAPQGTAGSVVYNTITGFNVLASNDASSWTTITTVSSISTGYPNWNAGTLRTFSFTNTTEYRYWRLQATSTTGSDGAGTSISDWQITGTTSNVVTGKGGMVWTKIRSAAASPIIVDSVRGGTKVLTTDTIDPAATETGYHISSFNTDGYSLQGDTGTDNSSAQYTYASWTFAKQPKFFDIVTFTIPATPTNTNRRISHALGSTPGAVFVKVTDAGDNWKCYHRSIGRNKWLNLNTTGATYNGTNLWGTSDPSSTDFGLDETMFGGGTYVAYVFAHDAAGFGLTGTDNVISCGSYTCDGSGNFSVNLGWEPQWILYKRTNSATSGGWFVVDNMRGLPATASSTAYVQANTTAAEVANANTQPNATGFSGSFVASAEFIYIAIRRGPMKVPTDGTKVFKPVTRTGTSAAATVTAGFSHDLLMVGVRNQSYGTKTWDRLRGITNPVLYNNAINAEYSGSSDSITAGTQTGITVGADSDWTINHSGDTYVNWFFKRAPGFFDVVCFTGNGTYSSVTHNLKVVPELIIQKTRTPSSAYTNWWTWCPNTSRGWGILNGSGAFNTGEPVATSTTFDLLSDTSGHKYVAYLFASCLGVSKVGAYTGNGSSQTINCDFTSGARYVMIKRTDTPGDWYVWDTARGIVSGNDSRLSLNSAGQEITTDDSIDPASLGFTVNQLSVTSINASGATYIFLAIA